MILKNSKGKERNFKLLFKLEYKNNTYLTYKDPISGKFYSGKLKGNTLKSLNEEEMIRMNKVLERINW